LTAGRTRGGRIGPERRRGSHADHRTDETSRVDDRLLGPRRHVPCGPPHSHALAVLEEPDLLPGLRRPLPFFLPRDGRGRVGEVHDPDGTLRRESRVLPGQPEIHTALRLRVAVPGPLCGDLEPGVLREDPVLGRAACHTGDGPVPPRGRRRTRGVQRVWNSVGPV